MLIDCDGCVMRGLACSDCVVTVLLGDGRAELDSDERAAIGVLAEAGLVPPLRLVEVERAKQPPPVGRTDETEENRPEGFAGAREAG